MKSFEQLQRQVEMELGRAARWALVEQFAAAAVDRERYGEFLNDLYPVVEHFCPIMRAAAARCPEELSAVRRFLCEHAEEEKGHERWVLEDCEAVGGRAFAEEVRTARPRAELQGMIGFNYAVSDREHPAGALGMVLALESMAARIAGIAAAGMSRHLRLPDPLGVRFLSSHGPLDARHLGELHEVLGGIDDPQASAAIANAVHVNFELFGAAFE